MQLRPGQRLHSQVCDGQLVVVKAPKVEVDLRCGGETMLEDVPLAPPATRAVDGDGLQLGKRYADDELGLELLCCCTGAGTLTVEGRTIDIKGAKPLPSSD